VELSLASGAHEREDVSPLLAKRGVSSQDAADELAARGALGAEAGLAPEDPMPHGPFGSVVRRFDSFVVHEVPEAAADTSDPCARPRLS